MKLQDFIAANLLKFSCTRINSRPDGLSDNWERNARHFKTRITRGRRGFTVYFSQGSAHKDDPTLEDVLDCLASDAASYENANTFEDWASEYGYDTDSRKAEKMFRAVKRQSEQLKRLLPDDSYQELLWDTERL